MSPLKPDRGTPYLTSELYSKPEEMIYYPYITSDQLAPSRIPNPWPTNRMILPYVICNLHTTAEGVGSFRAWVCPYSWLANFIIKFFTPNFYVCISFCQCVQVDGLKYWGSITITFKYLHFCLEFIFGIYPSTPTPGPLHFFLYHPYPNLLV